MQKFTPEAMRSRQAEIKAEISAIKAKTVPMREEYDRYSQETTRKLREMAESLKAAEAPLFELQNEAGLIAKALGGKAMSRKIA